MKRIGQSSIFKILLPTLLLVAVMNAGCSTRIKGKPVSKSLPHFSAKLASRERIVICAFGDSVTYGATQMGVLDFDNVYHNRLKQLLEQPYPDTEFHIINAGVDGDSSHKGLKRLEKDVLQQKPDLVLIEFGLNDCTKGLNRIDSFKANIQKMIDQIKANTASDIILMTPNFMATSDNPNVSAAHRKKNYPAKLSKLQNSGVVAAYASALREIGLANKIPIADVYARWEQLAATMNTNDLLSNGLNHPNKQGHLLMAHTILALIAPDFQVDTKSD